VAPVIPWPAIVGGLLKAATILSALARILFPVILGGMGLWFMFNLGQQVLTGVQYAAPGLGAAFGSIGMMFSMFPMMMMMFMMMSMFTMLMKVFE